MTNEDATIDIREIIKTFAMERHHAAGWISRHYSDSEVWGRSKLSSMYYLVSGDEPLPLHKLEGLEIWHYYMGAPAEMIVTNGSRLQETSVLGRDLAAGERPQLAVPAYFWQSCRSLGKWTLLGCTMSPGYSPRSNFVVDAQS